MSKLKSILTIFLLANFWVCMVHCQMGEGCGSHDQSFPLVLDHDHSESSRDHSDHDCKSCHVCDWVHSGGIYVSNVAFYVDHTIAVTFWNHDFTRKDSLSNEFLLGVLTAAPPHLLKSWQFVFRTALPVRAPSVLS